MKTLQEQLSQYAEYHRDKRNILTHFVGIPLIVLAVAILLSRPQFHLLGLGLSLSPTPALLVVIVTSLYYLKLDRPLGIAMALFLGGCLWLASLLAAQSTAVWLGSGIGLFVGGWIIQFVGHIYERRKPAFFDDVIGLAIGPLFVAAEFAFLLGLRRELQEEIEAVAGPTVIKGQTEAS